MSYSLKRENKGYINIMPLQTGGILTKAAKEVLLEFGDGYSVCDYCEGVLEKIRHPPIEKFVEKILPSFLGSDIACLTSGAREGKFLVFHSLCKPSDTIIVDGNKHYTTIVAAERAGLNVIEVANSGYPEYRINVEDYIPLIEKHSPKLILLTFPDGNYGNLPDAKRLGEIASSFKVPFLLNAAYSLGRMPLKMNEVGADFIIGSAHKSMASAGPAGVLGMKEEWEDILLKSSKVYKNKKIEFLGCTLRGLPLATLMASFPEVVERIKGWQAQVEKARWFSEELEKLGIKQLGEKPHQHDLMFFESPMFYKISQKHPDGRYFLYKELKKRGIWGIKPGLTKNFKLSTFAASKEELERVISAFNVIGSQPPSI
ncbi:MAG: O-phospho-L-seryl-tRNA:Cys-tRNA synthase [bacterium]